MVIALNIFMAGLIVVGIVTLLARSIRADRLANANRQTIPTRRPDLAHAARTHSRGRPATRTAGVHS